jgi:DNA-binding NarL/FixJ family response regulator
MVDQPGRAVSVLVVDDQELFRHGLCTVLGTPELGFEVSEAGDGDEALAKVAELAPDVVLMDVRMPGLGGIEATRRIRETAPSTRVVMLTASDEEDDLYGAIRVGATGYLLKDSSLDQVADAVRAVADGQSLLSPSMASKLLAEFSALTGGTAAGEAPGPRLSDRELEVLKLVAQGRNNRETAEALHLSENTVKNHVSNILDKLQVRNRLDAVLYAMRAKLFEL